MNPCSFNPCPWSSTSTWRQRSLPCSRASIESTLPAINRIRRVACWGRSRRSKDPPGHLRFPRRGSPARRTRIAVDGSSTCAASRWVRRSTRRTLSIGSPSVITLLPHQADRPAPRRPATSPSGKRQIGALHSRRYFILVRWHCAAGSFPLLRRSAIEAPAMGPPTTSHRDKRVDLLAPHSNSKPEYR